MANTPAFDLDAFGNTPMNCMTLIAGKAASATGHVLVGHNEDDGGHVVVRHGWVPPRDWEKGAVMPAEEGCALLPQDRKSTRLNSSHLGKSRMPSSA